MNVCPACQNPLRLVPEGEMARLLCGACGFNVVISSPQIPDHQPPPEAVQDVEITENAEERVLPPLLKRATNFGKAMVNHARDGFKKCPPKIYASRLDICWGCDKLIKDETRETTGSCTECGCSVSTKARWASEACPIGKWGIYKESGGGCGSCGKNS